MGILKFLFVYLFIICLVLPIDIWAAPTITGLDSDVLTYTENQNQTLTPAYVDIGSNAAVTSTAWNGATLQIEFSPATVISSDDFLYFGNNGTGAGQMEAGWISTGLGTGNYVTYEGTVIGTWQGGGGYNGTAILITFNASATNANVSAILKFLIYSNNNRYTPDLTQRNIKYTLTDGTGSAIANSKVDIVPVNDAPKYLGAGFTVRSFDFANGYAGGGFALAQQSDGKYIAVYLVADINWDTHLEVARYTNDGVLDQTFGTNGLFITDKGRTSSSSNQLDVLVRTDGPNLGKIVVGFTDKEAGDDFISLLQLTTSGVPDASFGTGGFCSFNLGASGSLEEICAIEQQADGKIVAAGSMYFNVNSDRDITLWRFKSDGSGLDTDFNTIGYVSTNISNSYSYGYDVAIQADGKILLAGVVHGSNTTTDPWDWGILRYNADGTLDNSFGTTGMVQIDYTLSDETATRIAIQKNGLNAEKIVVCGNYTLPGTSTTDITMVRLTSVGTIDNTFGTAGRFTLDVGGANTIDYINNIVLDGNDNIYFVGQSNSSPDIVKVSNDGALDLSWNLTGKLIVSDIGEDPILYNLILDNAGKVVVIGTVNSARINALTDYGDGYGAIIRYNTDGTMDAMGSQTFTEGGTPIVIDADMLVYDGEMSATNFAGSTLSIYRHGGASADDVFSAKSGGTLSALTQGANAIVGVTTIGTVTTNSAGTLLVTFNANATDLLVTSLINNIAYSNSSITPPASLTLDIVFNDMNSGAQGTGGASLTTAHNRISLIDVLTIIDNPSDFIAAVSSSTQINLVWTKNLENDDVLVAYNTVNTFGAPSGAAYVNGSSIAGGGTVVYAGSNSNYNHTGLSPNTEYYYKIWSKNSTDEYSTGLIDNEFTLANTPLPPTLSGATSTSVNVVINSNSNSSTTEYAIRAGAQYVQLNGALDGAVVWQTKSAWETDGLNTVKTITPLTPNTNYIVDVIARNGSGLETVYSNTNSLRTLAVVPAAPIISAVTDVSANVAIDLGTNTAGTPFAIWESGSSQYVQTVGTLGNNPAWQTESQWEVNAGLTAITVTSLTPNTAYTFQLKARNEVPVETALGASATLLTLASIPGAPIVGNSQATSLDVTVNSDGNPSTTQYVIQETSTGNYVQAGGTLGAGEVWNTATNWGTRTVIGLTTGNSYTFQVKAKNSNNIETIYGLTTTGIAIASPTVQALNLNFTNITRTSMTLTWARGNGDSCLLLARETYKIPSNLLSDNTTYHSNSSSYIDALNSNISGTRVLYKGNSANPLVNVSNMTKYKLYYFKVCEYNNNSGELYLQTENATNPKSRWTLRKEGEELVSESEFNIYPNPAQDNLNYTIPLAEQSEVISEVYSSDGRLIKSINHGICGASEPTFNLQVTDLPNGTYLLRINTGSDELVGIFEVIR